MLHAFHIIFISYRPRVHYVAPCAVAHCLFSAAVTDRRSSAQAGKMLAGAAALIANLKL
jgi:hypothetical protein